MTYETATYRSFNLLKYAYGITLVVIGIDTVLEINTIANWQGYVSEFTLSVLPIGAPTIALVLGVAEIAVSVLILTYWTRAARDVLVAHGLVVLTRFSDARGRAAFV